MNFSFNVYDIDLVAGILKVVYAPANSALPQIRKRIPMSLEVLDLPESEAKEAMRTAIVEKAPVAIWQAELNAQSVDVSPSLLELVGEDFEVPANEYEQSTSGDAVLPEEEAELTPSEQIERLVAIIANIRYLTETEGLVWVDSESVSWLLDTSTESQNRFASARLAVEAGTRSDGSVWKCATLDEYGTPSLVFRPTTNLEIIEWSDLCHAHVQKCFEAEALAAGKALSGDLTADFMTEYAAL